MTRPPSLRLTLAVAGIAALAGATDARSQQRAKSSLPVQLQVLYMPPPFRADGRSGMAYEVHLANYRDLDLTLLSLDVLPADDTTRRLATLSGPDLLRCLRRPGRPAATPDPALIHGGEFAVVFVWFALDSATAAPRALVHRAVFERRMADGTSRRYTVEGAVVDVPSRSPFAIRPPVPAGRWLLANGPSMLGPHRLDLQAVDGRATSSQRFASDWMLLGADGRLADSTAAGNGSWHGYGSPVLAVADGEVVEVRDGIPENEPLAAERAVPNRRETIGGNSLVLRVGSGVFAYYAHLRPGSLRVAVGDRVRSGQVLAQIGNSGNSDAPHLHFHLTDSADPLAGEGVPFALDAFRVLDVLSAEGWDPMVQQHAPWQPPVGGRAMLRRREMPTGDAVIEFQNRMTP